MVGNLLIRGMSVGVLAGLLAFVFAYVFGEPWVDWAIGFEGKMDAMKGMAEEPELVSRGVQSTFGLLTGVIVMGAALGGIFSIAYAFALGRLGRLSAPGTAVVVAVACFVTFVLVPQIKFPANPPSIGNPDTIVARTGLYFTMLGTSVLIAILCTMLARSWSQRHSAWLSTLMGIALYAVLMGIAMKALPTVDEVPDGFAANALWHFRLASIGIGAVICGTLGIAFGYIAERYPLAVESTAH